MAEAMEEEMMEITSRFHGRMGRGAMRQIREQKRQEADQRNIQYRLRKALESSEAGDVQDLGDFTQYAE